MLLLPFQLPKLFKQLCMQHFEALCNLYWRENKCFICNWSSGSVESTGDMHWKRYCCQREETVSPGHDWINGSEWIPTRPKCVSAKEKKSQVIYLAAISQEKRKITICVSKEAWFSLYPSQFFAMSTWLRITIQNLTALFDQIIAVSYKPYNRACKI